MIEGERCNMGNFDRILFDALRAVPITRKETEVLLCDKTLCDAVSFNDFLISKYNLTLSPEDLLKVVRNEAIDELSEKLARINALSYEKMAHARTMYTAKQAQTIDTAVFRFHQYLHYMSTYGVEFYTGEPVSRGWLPYETDSETELTEDIKIAKATRISVIFEDEKYDYIYRKVAKTRNRATAAEKQLFEEAVHHVSLDIITTSPIAFKENIPFVFTMLFDTLSGEDRIKALHAVCANTNDALRCVNKILDSRKWNLKTTEKRALVKLLETYPVSDFTGNLMPSNKRREKNLALLKHLDFNTYSRSEAHKKAVSDLRNDNLRSWEGTIKKAFADGDKYKALKIVSERPGMAIRMANWLIKNGLEPDEIADAIRGKADTFSTQTLVENINTFMTTDKDNLVQNKERLVKVMKELLTYNLASKTTPLKNRTVFIEDEDFDLSRSVLYFNKKAPSSNFIASGLARKLDFKDARYIRIFAYWEDAYREGSNFGERVDIDLHAMFLTRDGTQHHVGWNAANRKEGVYTSGDIVHSSPYGAEFIDVDLENENLGSVNLLLTSYTRQKFKYIRNLAVGILPVSKLGMRNNKELFSPWNCLLLHRLDYDARRINYGTVDVRNRILYFDGILGDEAVPKVRTESTDIGFSLKDYVELLTEAQNATVVENREDAEVVLTFSKPNDDREICIIDENYFADCK